jgi:hypothetical protein
MMSDGERRSWAEIEAALLADDPAFVQRLSVQDDRRRQRRIVAYAGISISVVLFLIALVVGSLSSVGIALLGLGASLTLLVTNG